MGTSAKNGREWSVWKASTNFHPMKFHEHVDTTYPKINYKLQLVNRQDTRDMAHTKTPNGSKVLLADRSFEFQSVLVLVVVLTLV